MYFPKVIYKYLLVTIKIQYGIVLIGEIVLEFI